jgi:hypothetical protein
MMSQVLHQQLGLEKKSARWVTNLLSDNQMAEQMQTSQTLIDLVWRAGKSILNRIITVDKSVMSMHKLEAKQHPKQWLENGVPGPVVAKAHATRTKTMVLTFLTPRESCTTTMSPRAKLSTLSAYSKCYKSSRGS